MTLSRLLLKPATLIAVLAGLNTAAMAQVTLRPEAGSANPGRVGTQIQPPVAAPEAPNTPVEVRRAPVASAPAGADTVHFVLNRLTVEDVTAYAPEQLEPLYAARLHHSVSLADLYAIAAEITRKYRNDGYILTQVVVPPQTIADGNVRLKVVEGFVNEIAVEGVKDFEQEQITGYARQLADHAPLNVRDLERALLLINDLPGVKARSVLSPSRTVTGAADLTIIVTRKVVDAEIDFNNYGTKYLGPYQAGASVALNSALGLNERITGQTVYAPGAHFDPELQYYALGYLQPIGPYGTTVELDGSYTRTNPGFTLKQFNTIGNAEYGGLTVAQPFIRSRQTNLTGRLIVDERDVDTANTLEDNRKDRIRTVRVGGKYETLDTYLGQGAYNMADLQLTQGLGRFGATDGGADTSRPGADQGFTKLNLELQRLQRLAPSFNLLLGATGQVAANKLTTTEQFGVGGQDYGRGYDPSEIIGDHGVAGKAELQWENSAASRLHRRLAGLWFLRCRQNLGARRADPRRPAKFGRLDRPRPARHVEPRDQLERPGRLPADARRADPERHPSARLFRAEPAFLTKGANEKREGNFALVHSTLCLTSRLRAGRRFHGVAAGRNDRVQAGRIGRPGDQRAVRPGIGAESLVTCDGEIPGLGPIVAETVIRGRGMGRGNRHDGQ